MSIREQIRGLTLTEGSRMQIRPKLSVAAGANQPIALITGANRGIGFEVARILARQGMHVIIGARTGHKAEAAARKLVDDNLSAVSLTLDVSKTESIAKAALDVATDYGRLNVLINNAAHFGWEGGVTGITLDNMRQTMETNFFGIFSLCLACYPLLCEGSSPRIVNVSSLVSSFGDGEVGLTSDVSTNSAYMLSKSLLNAFTIRLAKDMQKDNILVNAVCPGLTDTFPGAKEMGARAVSKSAEGVAWAAMLPDNGPTGGFFRDGEPIPW